MNDPSRGLQGGRPAAPDQTAAAQRKVLSEEILKGAREVLIEHGHEIYRLRLTRNGKLILQK